VSCPVKRGGGGIGREKSNPTAGKTAYEIEGSNCRSENRVGVVRITKKGGVRPEEPKSAKIGLCGS